MTAVDPGLSPGLGPSQGLFGLAAISALALASLAWVEQSEFIPLNKTSQFKIMLNGTSHVCQP